MDSYQNYEQEIDLKDLMFAVLRRWRPIILTAIVFALLLGGFKAFKGLRQMKDPEFLAEKEQEYMDSLDQYEISKARLSKEIENIKISLESQNEYMEKSILMNINPYDEYVASASFYVSTDYQIMPGMVYQNPDTVSSIMAAYMSMIQDGEMYNYVLKGMDSSLDRRYLQELVTVMPDYNNHMFSIRVIHSTEEGAEHIMSLIMDSLEEYYGIITQAIGTHKLNVIMDTKPTASETVSLSRTEEAASEVDVYTIIDLELERLQQDQSLRTGTLNQSLTDKTKELREMKEPTSSVPSRSGLLKSGIKYAALGGVLGAFMAAFFICVAFLMGDKLTNEKDLRRRYGLIVLGVFGETKRKQIFSSVDRFLDHLEGIRAEKMAPDIVQSVVAANVMNYVGEAKKILLVTSSDSMFLDSVSSQISPVLPELSLMVGGNLDWEAEAIKKAADCDAVILVEKRGTSTFSGIERELGMVKSLDKKVLGCIIL